MKKWLFYEIFNFFIKVENKNMYIGWDLVNDFLRSLKIILLV